MVVVLVGCGLALYLGGKRARGTEPTNLHTQISFVLMRESLGGALERAENPVSE